MFFKKMNILFKILAFIFLSVVFVSGCFSMGSLSTLKKEVVLMSPLEGRLTYQGQALKNTAMDVVIVLPGGDEKSFQYKTDEDGFFKIPALYDRMYIGPMTEFAVSQFIDVDFNGAKTTIWSAGKRDPGLYAERNPPRKAVGVTCDLSGETKRYKEGAGYIKTKCHWVELTDVF